MICWCGFLTYCHKAQTSFCSKSLKTGRRWLFGRRRASLATTEVLTIFVTDWVSWASNYSSRLFSHRAPSTSIFCCRIEPAWTPGLSWATLKHFPSHARWSNLSAQSLGSALPCKRPLYRSVQIVSTIFWGSQPACQSSHWWSLFCSHSLRRPLYR